MSSEVLARREAVRTDRVARYERMVEIRALEDAVRGLFAEGLVHGTTHTCQGQEAVSVGVASALRPTDSVCCTYRGHGMGMALGLTSQQVCGEIMGRVVGSIGGVGGSMHLCETSIGLLPTMAIVGAGVPVAAGAALTAQVRGIDAVAVAVFGDGAANIASAMKARGIRRVVFISAGGVGESWKQMPWYLKLVCRAMLRTILGEHAREEEIFASSALDWTAVRAAVLTNKPATGRIVASNAGPIKTIPRADLAAFLVAELVNQDYVNRAISVTSGQ